MSLGVVLDQLIGVFWLFPEPNKVRAPELCYDSAEIRPATSATYF